MAANTYRAALGGAFAFLAAGLLAGALIATLAGGLAWWLIAIAIAVALTLAFGTIRRVNVRVRASENTEQPPALPVLAREILEAVPDPLLLVDDCGRVLFANRAMAAVAGTEAERKPVSAVLRVPAVLEAIERTSETGESADAEFIERVPVERHYQALVTKTEHSPQLIAVLLHDLTALKRAEQSRADFIANVSHELRTPLAALTGFIDTLRGHAREDEAARERFLDIMSI